MRSKDEIAYESYLAMCKRVDVSPMTFEDWYKKSQGMESEEQAADWPDGAA